MMSAPRKNGTCGNCTIKLVTIAYRRAPWFRLMREPLLVGMRALAAIHHVNTAEYPFPTAACHGCIRFYKVGLREKSATFRRLHRRLNPAFDYVLGKIVTKEELGQTVKYARAASQGALNEVETSDWMRGMKIRL